MYFDAGAVQSSSDNLTSIYCFGMQKSFKMLQQLLCVRCVCVWSTAEKSQELVTAIHQSLYLAGRRTTRPERVVVIGGGD